MREQDLIEELRGMIAGWHEQGEVSAEAFVNALDDHLAMLATAVAPDALEVRAPPGAVRIWIAPAELADDGYD
jgi:hypothetical protein